MVTGSNILNAGITPGFATSCQQDFGANRDGVSDVFTEAT